VPKRNDGGKSLLRTAAAAAAAVACGRRQTRSQAIIRAPPSTSRRALPLPAMLPAACVHCTGAHAGD
jgi:hypothetical protein